MEDRRNFSQKCQFGAVINLEASALNASWNYRWFPASFRPFCVRMKSVVSDPVWLLPDTDLKSVGMVNTKNLISRFGWASQGQRGHLADYLSDTVEDLHGDPLEF